MASTSLPALAASQQILSQPAAPILFLLLTAETQIVRGRGEVLKLGDLLTTLCARNGQAGAMDHLEYFLNFKESLHKTPCLVLVGQDLHTSGLSLETVRAAVLVYEHRLPGWNSKIYATDDVSGRRTMTAPGQTRLHYAKVAVEALMREGARAVVLSFADQEPGSARRTHVACKDGAAWTYTLQGRLTRSYLPLESTLAATFAKIGQRTRSNMRYYRRRAEAQLGCHFVEQVQIDRAEFQALNRRCAYAISDEQAGARYDSIQRYPAMFLCGIRQGNGEWLSLVGGRHYGKAAEIDWQMNRNDLPAYSLSAVMRACLIEHEIGRGSEKLFIEGGTRQALRLSFVNDQVCDLAVVRGSLLLKLLRRSLPVMLKLVNRYAPKSNHPLRLLTDQKLQWRPWA